MDGGGIDRVFMTHWVGLAVEHEHCLRGVSISATFFAPSFLTERISSSFSSAALFKEMGVISDGPAVLAGWR